MLTQKDQFFDLNVNWGLTLCLIILKGSHEKETYADTKSEYFHFFPEACSYWTHMILIKMVFSEIILR